MLNSILEKQSIAKLPLNSPRRRNAIVEIGQSTVAHKHGTISEACALQQ